MDSADSQDSVDATPRFGPFTEAELLKQHWSPQEFAQKLQLSPCAQSHTGYTGYFWNQYFIPSFIPISKELFTNLQQVYDPMASAVPIMKLEFPVILWEGVSRTYDLCTLIAFWSFHKEIKTPGGFQIPYYTWNYAIVPLFGNFLNRVKKAMPLDIIMSLFQFRYPEIAQGSMNMFPKIIQSLLNQFSGSSLWKLERVHSIRFNSFLCFSSLISRLATTGDDCTHDDIAGLPDIMIGNYLQDDSFKSLKTAVDLFNSQDRPFGIAHLSFSHRESSQEIFSHSLVLFFDKEHSQNKTVEIFDPNGYTKSLAEEYTKFKNLITLIDGSYQFQFQDTPFGPQTMVACTYWPKSFGHTGYCLFFSHLFILWKLCQPKLTLQQFTSILFALQKPLLKLLIQSLASAIYEICMLDIVNVVEKNQIYGIGTQHLRSFDLLECAPDSSCSVVSYLTYDQGSRKKGIAAIIDDNFMRGFWPTTPRGNLFSENTMTQFRSLHSPQAPTFRIPNDFRTQIGNDFFNTLHLLSFLIQFVRTGPHSSLPKFPSIDPSGTPVPINLNLGQWRALFESLSSSPAFKSVYAPDRLQGIIKKIKSAVGATLFSIKKQHPLSFEPSEYRTLKRFKITDNPLCYKK